MTALSLTSVPKRHVSDKWAWHANPPLARCETKGWRQIFPLFHAHRKGHKELVGTSTSTTCFHIVFLARTLSQTALPLCMDMQCTKTNSKKTIKSPAIKLGRGYVCKNNIPSTAGLWGPIFYTGLETTNCCKTGNQEGWI